MQKQWASSRRTAGFTLVELIIVIVVISILASITIVAYKGVQGRARDVARQSALSDIRQALEAYKGENGSYPDEASTTWEYSYTDPANFLAALKPYMGKVPVDPINNTSDYFYYYRYPAGTNSWGVTCPANRGDFYVLGVVGLDSGQGTTMSPGWNCENGATVPTNGAWVPSATRAAWGSFTD